MGLFFYDVIKEQPQYCHSLSGYQTTIIADVLPNVLGPNNKNKLSESLFTLEGKVNKNSMWVI